MAISSLHDERLMGLQFMLMAPQKDLSDQHIQQIRKVLW
jgi:RecG-like helicase